MLLQALCLGVAGYCAHLLGAREPGRRWIEHRLKAEDGRQRMARLVLTIGHEKGPDVFRNAGDWFIVFIDDQLHHLEGSAERRDRARGSLASVGALLASLMALTAALASLSQQWVIVLVAFAGVCAPALIAAVKSWGEATADAQRAELHAATWSSLNQIRRDVAAFRAAVEAHDLDASLAYADKVFAVLRQDHAGFAAVHGAPSPGPPSA